MRTQGVFQRRGGIWSVFCLLLREGLTTIPTEIVNHLDAISADRFLFFCKLVYPGTPRTRPGHVPPERTQDGPEPCHPPRPGCPAARTGGKP